MKLYALVVYYNLCNVLCIYMIPAGVIENVTTVATPTFHMDTLIFKNIIRYHCGIGDFNGVNLLMYGTKAWTFPQQDVNLTLKFPTAKDTNSEWKDYLIAGFQVVLYIDGSTSDGFLIDGGMLQDTITLCFTSKQITMMRYQFWVYGIRKDTFSVIEKPQHLNTLCN